MGTYSNFNQMLFGEMGPDPDWDEACIECNGKGYTESPTPLEDVEYRAIACTQGCDPEPVNDAAGYTVVDGTTYFTNTRGGLTPVQELDSHTLYAASRPESELRSQELARLSKAVDMIKHGTSVQRKELDRKRRIAHREAYRDRGIPHPDAVWVISEHGAYWSYKVR